MRLAVFRHSVSGVCLAAAAGLVCVIVLTCYQYSPAFETEVMMMSALFLLVCVVRHGLSELEEE